MWEHTPAATVGRPSPYHRVVPHAGRHRCRKLRSQNCWITLLRSRVLQEHNLPEHGNRKQKGRLSREQGAL
jgi:hypothetical protein